MSHRFALAFALIALPVLAAGQASAFTYDNRTNQSDAAAFRSGGAPKQDPKSGFSVHFSGGGYGQTQSGASDRFLPSYNGAFSSRSDAPNGVDTALGDRH